MQIGKDRGKKGEWKKSEGLRVYDRPRSTHIYVYVDVLCGSLH